MVQSVSLAILNAQQLPVERFVFDMQLAAALSAAQFDRQAQANQLPRAERVESAHCW